MSDPRTDRGAESASLIGIKANAELARLRTVIATLVRNITSQA